jgi:NAD(P)-dependent dehydrogenase (short-subunit alcohol dehydrogenase family)
MFGIRRRDLITLLGGALAWPSAVCAQRRESRNVPRIGWLVPGAQDAQSDLEEYRRGMRELGYVEGRTIKTEYVYADGRADRMSELAAVLVADNVDVIVTATPYKSAYVTSKHGIVGLTNVTALEAAERAVTCNAICPGYVYTPLVEAQIDG